MSRQWHQASCSGGTASSDESGDTLARYIRPADPPTDTPVDATCADCAHCIDVGWMRYCPICVARYERNGKTDYTDIKAVGFGDPACELFKEV